MRKQSLSRVLSIILTNNYLTTTTDYSREQLIDALQREYADLCREDYDAEIDLPLDKHLTMLKSMSHADLIKETSTDDEFTLADFMNAYS